MSCGTDVCPLIQSGGGSNISKKQYNKSKKQNKISKTHTKKNTKRFKIMKLEDIIQLYKANNELIEQIEPIEYYYTNGCNPNRINSDDPKILIKNDIYKYHFIPNGNLITRKYGVKSNGTWGIINENITKNYLSSDNPKMPYKKNLRNNTYYFLEGKHNFGNKYIDSQMQICSSPLNSLSDSCISGPNWISVGGSN
jgi:hypothetical protein